MFKPLFDPQNTQYTRPAEELVSDFNQIAQAVMRHWQEKGFSPREIAHIMRAAVDDVELETCIGLRKSTPPVVPLRVVNG